MIDLFEERGNTFLRLLDRYIGIPLVFFLSLFRKKKDFERSPSSPKSIALLKMSGIGDSVLTLPFIQKLQSTYQNIEITVVCGTNNRVVYQNLLDKKYVANVICLDLGRFLYDWAYLKKKIKELRTSRYDYCIDFDAWSRVSALLSFLINGDYNVGFRTEGQHRHTLFDHYEIHQDTKHEFDNYNLVMSSLIDQVQQVPTYPLDSEDALYFAHFMEEHNVQKFIVFHPWASGYKNTLKELDKGAITYICNKLIRKGYTIIMTGGPADMEKSESLTNSISGSFSIAGKTNLNETAIFLKNAHCVLSVNTGTLHLAAAVGANLVSINGPTNINRWGPLCEHAINIKSSLHCSPCLNLGFEYKCKENNVPEGYCMKKVDLDEVVNSALRLIQDCKPIDTTTN